MKNLEPLPTKSGTHLEEKTIPAIEVDGEVDGTKTPPVHVPKKRFFLDPLL